MHRWANFAPFPSDADVILLLYMGGYLGVSLVRCISFVVDARDDTGEMRVSILGAAGAGGSVTGTKKCDV